MSTRVLLLLLALAACRPAPSRPTPTAPVRLQLFLLAGQSNMAGRGKVEAQDRVPVPHVWMLDSAGAWRPAVEPVQFDKPNAVGVGPGRAFGIAMHEAEPGVEIGLVPVAVGGSAITTWEPGARDASTNTHPYDDAIRRARIAQRNGTLAGILWHQGESDSNARSAPLYAERLRALVARFRADLGAPDVPFIAGQVGRFAERPWTQWREQMNAASAALPSELRNAGYVSAEGLTHRGDTLHFDAASARELGRRYAAEYRRVRATMR